MASPRLHFINFIEFQYTKLSSMVLCCMAKMNLWVVVSWRGDDRFRITHRNRITRTWKGKYLSGSIQSQSWQCFISRPAEKQSLSRHKNNEIGGFRSGVRGNSDISNIRKVTLSLICCVTPSIWCDKRMRNLVRSVCGILYGSAGSMCVGWHWQNDKIWCVSAKQFLYIYYIPIHFTDILVKCNQETVFIMPFLLFLFPSCQPSAVKSVRL